MTRKRPACGSEKIIPNAMSLGMHGQFYYEGNPDALIRKDRVLENGLRLAEATGGHSSC